MFSGPGRRRCFCGRPSDDPAYATAAAAWIWENYSAARPGEWAETCFEELAPLTEQGLVPNEQLYNSDNPSQWQEALCVASQCQGRPDDQLQQQAYLAMNVTWDSSYAFFSDQVLHELLQVLHPTTLGESNEADIMGSSLVVHRAEPENPTLLSSKVVTELSAIFLEKQQIMSEAAMETTKEVWQVALEKQESVLDFSLEWRGPVAPSNDPPSASCAVSAAAPPLLVLARALLGKRLFFTLWPLVLVLPLWLLMEGVVS